MAPQLNIFAFYPNCLDVFMNSSIVEAVIDPRHMRKIQTVWTIFAYIGHARNPNSWGVERFRGLVQVDRLPVKLCFSE